MPTPRLLLTALVCAGTIVPATRAVTLTASATSAWVENISRTSSRRDAKDGDRHRLALAASWHRQLSRDWQGSVTSTAAWQTEPDFSALNTWQFGVDLAVMRKFGLGPLAPVVQANAGLHQAEVNESGRSRTETSAGLTVAKRLTTTLRAAAGIDWTQHYAKLAPFDVRNHRIHGGVTWDFLPSWRVGLGGSRQWGEVTANATWPVWGRALGGVFGNAVRDYYNSEPWLTTSTYGPGWVAYRVYARTDIWWAELAPALGDHTSLPLRYEHIEVRNRVGVRYVTEMWSLSILHRF